VDHARFSVGGLVLIAFVGFLLIVVLKRTPKLGVALLAVGGLLGLFLITARVRHSAPPPIGQGVAFMEFQGIRMVAPMSPPVPAAPRVHRLLETYPQSADVRDLDHDTLSGPVEPPVATSDDPILVELAPSEPVADSPFTVFQGLSASGKSVESPPLWVIEPIAATTEALPGTLSSERFATVEEAEQQLWEKLQSEVAEVMTHRFPDARGWQPPRDLLQRASVVLERCVERIEKTYGEHVVPMYRVHWKIALTDPTREMLALAWMPTVANERMFTVGSVFGGIAGGFLFLNLLLRGLTSSLWQRLWTRKTAAAAIAGVLLLAGAGVLLG
jgi:hypothetical protein